MRKRRVYAILLVVFSVCLTSVSFYIWQMLFTPNILIDQQNRILEIPRDITFKKLQKKLIDERYVKEPISFSVLAKWMDYDRSIKPGRYMLEREMTNLQAIRLLRSGTQVPVRMTFNNVRLLEDLPPKMTTNLEMDSTALYDVLLNPETAKKFGFDEATFIGMFIPNTYEVYWNIDPDQLLDRMNYEYKQFWNKERLARAGEIGLTPMEVSTLASIVKAESSKADEEARIAGVYINRLNKGIALQADPTLVYAVGDFTIKRVLNEHKEIDSPYNTYKNAGLPPGPINMPSIHAIDAVLDYEEHDYYYFCAKDDFSGYHAFANSYSEHLQNARKYQRALNRARLYR